MTDVARPELDGLSTEELVALRVDIGRLKQVKQAEAGRLQMTIDDITATIRAREKEPFEITDHAVVRYLQRVHGVDMDAVRSLILKDIMSVSERVKVKGEAVGVPVGEIVYVVARGNLVVTAYPAKPWERYLPAEIDAAIAEVRLAEKG